MIDFRPDLLSTATRLDLGYIEAAMLWPDDEGARARAREAVKAEFFMEAAEREDPAGAVPVAAARWLREVPPIDRRNSNERSKNGLIAGTVLLWAVGWHSLNPAMAGLSRNKKVAADHFGISTSTIENIIWPRFKPVVHLWAAILQRGGESPDDAVFPCKLADLEMFLAVAEHYRKAGETIRPPQARGTILRPGDALAIPIELPEVEILSERKSSILE